MNQARGKTVRSEIHKKILIIFRITKTCLNSGKSLLSTGNTKDHKTFSSNYQGMSLLPTTYKIVPNILITRWTPRVDKVTDFDATDQLLIIHSALLRLQLYGSPTVKQPMLRMCGDVPPVPHVFMTWIHRMDKSLWEWAHYACHHS
jgi:hypothetical protein